MQHAFGKRLRLLRLQQGLTQVQAARNAGITAPTWASYESGRRLPFAPRVAVLARAIGVPISALFANENETALTEVVLGARTCEHLERLAPVDLDREIERLSSSVAVTVAAEIRAAMRRRAQRDRPPTAKGRRGYRTPAQLERSIAEAKLRRAERLEAAAREASDAATGEV
jgi:transcriptional regulator with XRE-family HTH domain